MILLYAICLLLIGIFLCLTWGRTRRERKFVLTGFSISYLSRVGFIVLNENAQIFAAKGAAARSVKGYVLLKGGEPQWFDTFFVQTVINAPGFGIVGADPIVARVSNAFLVSLAAVVAYWYTSRLQGARRARVISLFTWVFPSSFAFSIFALRDGVVFFTLAAFAFSFIYRATAVLRAKERRRQTRFMWIAALCSISLRPELIAVIGAFAFLVYMRTVSLTRAQSLGRQTRASLLGASVMALATGGILVSIYYVYPFVLQNFGVQGGGVGPADLFERVTELRYLRQFKGDSGSSILAPEVYMGLEWWERWAIQLIGLIFLPLPWLLTDVSRWLALVDSLLILYLTARLYLGLLPEKGVAVYKAAIMTYWIGIIMMSTLVINAGNGFRMRLALIPFLLVAVSMFPRRLRWP